MRRDDIHLPVSRPVRGGGAKGPPGPVTAYAAACRRRRGAIAGRSVEGGGLKGGLGDLSGGDLHFFGFRARLPELTDGFRGGVHGGS